jgi:hypothetical protein
VHRDRQFVLAEGFAAQVPDSPDDFGMVHRDRQPLQEIVLPASLTEVHGLDRVQEEGDQSNWKSPRSSPRRWANGEMQPSALGKLSRTGPQPMYEERLLTVDRSSIRPECWISERCSRFLEG